MTMEHDVRFFLLEDEAGLLIKPNFQMNFSVPLLLGILLCNRNIPCLSFAVMK